MQFSPSFLDPDEKEERRIFVTPPLNNWLNQSDRRRPLDYKSDIRAHLRAFVVGGLVDNENDLRLLTPKDLNIWGFRIRFRPQTRIFGGVLLRDTFIATRQKLRKDLGSFADPRWNAEIAKVKQQWDSLFPGIARVQGRPFHNCIGKNYWISRGRGERMTTKMAKRGRIREEVLAEYWFAVRHKAFEEMLRAYRDAHDTQGLTQDHIAARLGRDKGFISRCLRGKENITLRTMSNIARAMDCRLDVAVSELSAAASASVHYVASAPIEKQFQYVAPSTSSPILVNAERQARTNRSMSTGTVNLSHAA